MTTVTRVMRRPVRTPASLAYLAACAAVGLTLATLSAADRHRIVLHTSTNLHNLWRGHVGTLLSSAFVLDGTPVWLVALAGLLLIAGERAWGSRRVVGVFLVGHVGATLIVAAGLSVAVVLGWLPHHVVHDPDVGLSYGVMAIAGGLTRSLPRHRTAWFAAWLGLDLVALAADPDFTSVGHLTALLLGLGVSARLARRAGPGRPRPPAGAEVRAEPSPVAGR